MPIETLRILAWCDCGAAFAVSGSPATRDVFDLWCSQHYADGHRIRDPEASWMSSSGSWST